MNPPWSAQSANFCAVLLIGTIGSSLQVHHGRRNARHLRTFVRNRNTHAGVFGSSLSVVLLVPYALVLYTAPDQFFHLVAEVVESQRSRKMILQTLRGASLIPSNMGVDHRKRKDSFRPRTPTPPRFRFVGHHRFPSLRSRGPRHLPATADTPERQRRRKKARSGSDIGPVFETPETTQAGFRRRQANAAADAASTNQTHNDAGSGNGPLGTTIPCGSTIDKGVSEPPLMK